MIYKKFDVTAQLPKPFYVFSSNVDAHFHTAGFAADEIFEIHGNIENWQCGEQCEKVTHKAPKDFQFVVDQTTMIAKDDAKIVEEEPKSGILWCNHPRCMKCKRYARPHVLMFGDYACLQIKSNAYDTWRRAVSNLANSKNAYNIVILEIGAGDRVPTVRHNSKAFTEAFDNPEKVTLIRINLDLPKVVQSLSQFCVPISIKSTGLTALLKINEKINQLQTKTIENDPLKSTTNTN